MGIARRKATKCPFKVGDVIQQIYKQPGELVERWKVTSVNMEDRIVYMQKIGGPGFHVGNMSFSIANTYYELCRGARGFVKQETNLRSNDGKR